MFSLHFKYLAVILLMLFVHCEGWLLAQAGLNESYRVLHLSTHFSRVFLSISVESQDFPTFIETQWPETFLPMRTMVYPHITAHAQGKSTDCTRIQQAWWSQVDSLSRLWVMDVGVRNEESANTCPPKLLAFDLIRNNAEVLRIDCSKHIKPNDKLLVVKLGPTPSSCTIEKFIYFIMDDSAYILAYDILEQTWVRRQLLSKKYISDMEEAFPIKPRDIAFGRERELLISDGDGALYTSPNSLLLSSTTLDDNDMTTAEDIELELLGSLLGPSKGMMADHLGALFYVVPKFGAVVRCIYQQNLTAEGNEIIYMTSKNIQQIFFGFAEGSVWLLTDRLLRPQDQCFPGL